MTEELKIKEELKDPQNIKHYKEFLSHLGIDPEDFDYEFDMEMDDYAN